MGVFIKRSLLILPLLLIMGACAATEQPEQNHGVEELNPGEQTFIQAPSRQPENASGVSERNI